MGWTERTQVTGSSPLVSLCCVCMLTWSQCFLSARVIFSWLLDVPGCQRQRLHVLQTVELQHVHVAAAALISGNEAAFATFKHIFDDFLSAHLIIHAEKHCNPFTGHVLGMSEQLKENTETSVSNMIREHDGSIITTVYNKASVCSVDNIMVSPQTMWWSWNNSQSTET